MIDIITGSESTRESSFGPGSGDIVLDNVKCTGLERKITDCPNSATINCRNRYNAGVKCRGKLK